MEATQANLDIKVTQLKMSIGKTNTIVEAGKAEAIERHLSTLRSLTTEINRMRLEVEASKLAAKVEIADIEAWNSGIDAQLEKADYEVDKIRTWVDDRKREAEAVVKQEELKFHKAKIQMQAEIQATAHPQEAMTTPSDIQAKLPKLTITKFDGTYKDWPRFWGQFTETIDKTSVPPITKFSYLRELLDFKVKRTIDRGVALHSRGIQSGEEYPKREVRKGVRNRQSLHQRDSGSPLNFKRKPEENW